MEEANNFRLTEFVNVAVPFAAILALFALLLMMASAAARSPRRWLSMAGIIACPALGLAPSYVSFEILGHGPSYSILFHGPGLLGGWKIFLVAKLLLAAFGMMGMWICLYRRRHAGFVVLALVQFLTPMAEISWRSAHGFMSPF